MTCQKRTSNHSSQGGPCVGLHNNHVLTLWTEVVKFQIILSVTVVICILYQVQILWGRNLSVLLSDMVLPTSSWLVTRQQLNKYTHQLEGQRGCVKPWLEATFRQLAWPASWWLPLSAWPRPRCANSQNFLSLSTLAFVTGCKRAARGLVTMAEEKRFGSLSKSIFPWDLQALARRRE